MGSGVMLGSINLADSATVSASSEAGDLSAQNLLDAVVARKWRSGPGSSAHIYVDLGATQSVSYIGVLGHNLGSAGGSAQSWTILGSTVSIGSSDALNLTASATGIYPDATPAAKRFGQPNGRAHRFFNAVSLRYLDILLSDSALAYVQAGRLVVMHPTELANGVSYGAGHSRADGRLVGNARGGQAYMSRGARQRRWKFALEYASESEAWNTLDAIDLLNGQTDDVLFCADVNNSSYLDQLTLWGPVEQVSDLSRANFPTFRRDYVIAERL